MGGLVPGTNWTGDNQLPHLLFQRGPPETLPEDADGPMQPRRQPWLVSMVMVCELLDTSPISRQGCQLSRNPVRATATH